MRKIVIMIITAILIPHFILNAEDIQKRFGSNEKYELSPILGGYIFEDESYDNSLMFGVMGLLHITNRYALEGEIGFSPSSFNYRMDVGPFQKENLNIYNYSCNFIYKYPLSVNIYSYGTFGIGGISFIPEKADSNSDMYFNFGGGIKFSYWDKMAIRLDLRQYAPSVDVRLFSPRSGSIYFGPNSSPKAQVQKIIQINVGIIFLFR